MSITWKFVKSLKDDEAVKTFLKQREVILPERLVLFLESHNSGRPSKPSFNTEGGTGYVFNSLYSYNASDANDITETYDLVFHGSNLYPIAIEAAGNVVCFNINEQSLVLWNHESEECEQIDTYSNQDLFDEII